MIADHDRNMHIEEMRMRKMANWPKSSGRHESYFKPEGYDKYLFRKTFEGWLASNNDKIDWWKWLWDNVDRIADDWAMIEAKKLTLEEHRQSNVKNYEWIKAYERK